jgi:Ribbon-helix-helix protein, copG family
MKRRHEFNLDEDLAERLAELAARPGASKSAIMADALRAWLERRAASEIDERFKVRLDRLSLQLGRIERDQQIVAETLALLARFQLTVSAPLAESDRAGRAIGQERFKSFLEQVSRRVAGGRGLIDDVSALTEAAKAKP